MILRDYVVSIWYWNIYWIKHKMLFCILCSRTPQKHRQSRKDKYRPWTVTAPPYRFMWLSNHHLTISLLSMEAAFRLGNQGGLDPKSNLCSRNGRYSGKEYRACLSTCYTIFKTAQLYTHVTWAHRSLTTRQYSQSLIKCAFDRTLRDKGSQRSGWEGTTPSGLHSWVCTMCMSSYLHVNPEVSQRGSRRRAL